MSQLARELFDELQLSRDAEKNACIETGRRIEIQRPTATENDERKEVAIVSIQGWPRSNGREQEHGGEKEKDEEGGRVKERDLLSQRTPVTEC